MYVCMHVAVVCMYVHRVYVCVRGTRVCFRVVDVCMMRVAHASVLLCRCTMEKSVEYVAAAGLLDTLDAALTYKVVGFGIGERGTSESAFESEEKERGGGRSQERT